MPDGHEAWLESGGHEDARLVLVGQVLGVLHLFGESGRAFVQQGEDLLDFDADLEPFLRLLSTPRTPAEASEWLRERGERDPDAYLGQLLDDGIVLLFGVDREQDVDAQERLVLRPLGTSLGPHEDAPGWFLIETAQDRAVLLSPVLYWTWVCSDGRPLAQVAARVADMFGVPVPAMRNEVAANVSRLLVPRAARLDLTR